MAGESLWAVYRRRFSKHLLGKVGLTILVILYGMAVFADILSPFHMTWSDKTKPYHHPTRLYLFDRTPTGLRFRPFVHEYRITSQAFRTYAVVPERTIRAVSIESRPYATELRVSAWESAAPARKAALLTAIAQHYRLASDSPELQSAAQAIDRLEQDSNPDARLRVPIGAGELLLAKGNKNYVGFFARGTPYALWGLAPSTVRLLGSETGGLFLIGTDTLGRDLWSRLLHGSRVSLSVGLIGAAITFVIGLLVGGISGYAGGRIDSVLMRLVEILLSIPSIYLLFALRAAVPPNLNSVQVYLIIIVILSLIGWAGLARVIRGLVLAIKTEDYVLAARTMGLSHFKIIARHVLPNTFSFVLVQITLSIPGYILGESALSLLGIGITEPQSSWGLMLSAARNYRVVRDFPWILIPGFFIFLAILAWNFFGDGIRDSLDPKSKH